MAQSLARRLASGHVGSPGTAETSGGRGPCQGGHAGDALEHDRRRTCWRGLGGDRRGSQPVGRDAPQGTRTSGGGRWGVWAGFSARVQPAGELEGRGCPASPLSALQCPEKGRTPCRDKISMSISAKLQRTPPGSVRHHLFSQTTSPPLRSGVLGKRTLATLPACRVVLR